MRLSLLPVVVMALAIPGGGCTAGGQEISGTAALATFPKPLANAQVVDVGGSIVADAAIASDGSFKLQVPPGTGLRIQFVAQDGTPALVFPRKNGAIDSRFDVRKPGAPFQLGSVRYVGDPSASQYRYQTKTQALTADQSGGDGDGECSDGVDADGAVCVDDDDDENATCEESGGADCVDGIDAATGAECDGGPAANGDDGEDDDEAGGVDCVDGIDAATGAECDGGPSANGDGDGEEGDDDEAADAPSEAAVADHNLPSSIGCADEEDDDGDSEEHDD